MKDSESSVSKGRDVPRDVPGQTGTGRSVVPLSQDKNISLSRCPFVPGQGQEQMSRDKLLCPGSVPGHNQFLFLHIFRKKERLFKIRGKKILLFIATMKIEKWCMILVCTLPAL